MNEMFVSWQKATKVARALLGRALEYPLACWRKGGQIALSLALWGQSRGDRA